MGYYLNNEEAYSMYKEIIDSPYFVDKSKIIDEIIPRISRYGKYICITRPRRFGKSLVANMLGAFFSKACDTGRIFDLLEISKSANYKTHLNRHNVIYIDFSNIDDDCSDYDRYISNIKELLKEDIREAYPDVAFRENSSVSEDLKRVKLNKNEKFIFIFDEWDAVFHMPFVTQNDKKKYILFLKSLFKGTSFVELVYMTGILPIAKYSSGSDLNEFLEYTMVTEEKFSEYFGFTEAEVDKIYERYLSVTDSPKVTREGLRIWYDGYHIKSGERMYNPRSVVASLTNDNLGNYWTSSGPYDEIFTYIEKNIDAVRDDLALMTAGTPVPARAREYAATSMNLSTKDEIFSAMVVYGFLSYENGYVEIPNKELMDKFGDMLMKEPALGYVYRLSANSERMLKATKAGDTKTMLEILEYAHDTEIPLLNYNNETDLTAVVNLVYLAARDSYHVEREDKGGRGYVDFIFKPVRNVNDDGIILELKIDSSPEEAIRQIKEKKYILSFAPKLGEPPVYKGRILAVGIAYDRENKKHSCKVEVLSDTVS